VAQLAARASASLVAGSFSHPRYVVKRPFWSILGRKFHVYAPDGSVVAFVKHPLLRLREGFTIFSDESETHALLTVRARQIVAFNIAHDVFDATTEERAGSIRSRGLRSLFRDTWDLLDPQDQPVGLVQEDGAALLRRFLPILPSKHHIELGGVTVATIAQRFRFFVKEFELDLRPNQGRLDPKFAIACTLLALMAESRREDRG
jgi:uncharacterized protein YxjI